MRKLASLGLAALCGCATLHSDGADRKHVGPPRIDRCARMGSAAQAYQKARPAAVVMVRKLSVDDQVCIDGDRPLANPDRSCQVRGFVEEVAPNAVELEIRDAPPDSPYTPCPAGGFTRRRSPTSSSAAPATPCLARLRNSPTCES